MSRSTADVKRPWIGGAHRLSFPFVVVEVHWYADDLFVAAFFSSAGFFDVDAQDEVEECCARKILAVVACMVTTKSL